jgi:hypothetical protein
MTTTDPSEDNGPTQAQREIQFYCRLIRIMMIMLVFWLLIFFLSEYNENVMVIACLAIFCLWLIYNCVLISCIVCPASASSSEEVVEPLTAGSEEDDDDEPFPYEFEETPVRIRNCLEPIPAEGPTNGVYTAVYSAIYYGKALRSEGQLELKFQEKENGWNIQGESIFGHDCTPIQEAFVNAKGEMYYMTSNGCIYRGILDFSSSTLFDGEFQSKTGPGGRIVRLELSKAQFYNSSVEMIEFSKTDQEMV